MSDIFSYNGGSMVAMSGKNCVSIACDRRLGQQYTTVATNYQRVFKMQDNILLGLTGLASDVSTFHAHMEYKLNLYNLRENRKMKVKTFINLLSHALYEKRFGPFFVTPIVIGLENGEKPLIATYDSIGCLSDNDHYQSGGTAADQLLGSCESYWKPDLNPEELQEILGQVLLSGCDRDIFSGWGGIVYTLTDGNLDIKVLKTKQC